MRHATLSLLVVTSLFMSGCVDFFTPDPAEFDDGEQADDNTLNQADESLPDGGPGDDGDTGDGSDDGNTSGGGEPAGGDPDPDNESEPEESLVVPPKDQLQDHPDDVDRPGEYAFLPRGSSNSAVTTEVPDWATGSTWNYRSSFGTYACDYTLKVLGTGTYFDVPVYDVKTSNANNCQNRSGETWTEQRWQDNLMEIDDEGYVEHKQTFPLEDGLKWRYHRYATSPDAHPTSEATVDYVPQYLWRTSLVAAWHIKITYPDTDLVIDRWYGIEAQNLLKEEYIYDGAPIGTLELRSYDL